MFAVSSRARKTEMAPVRISRFVLLNIIGSAFIIIIAIPIMTFVSTIMLLVLRRF